MRAKRKVRSDVRESGRCAFGGRKKEMRWRRELRGGAGER
jgi:hypothetical protein